MFHITKYLRRRTHQRWAAATVLAMALASFGAPSIAPSTIHAQGRPKKKPAVRQLAAELPGSLILGAIESVAVDDINDPASAGRMVVQGKQITIPGDLLIGLPTGRMTLRDLVLDAPAECKSQQQSGLAQSDSCLNGGSPALARIVAKANDAGVMVANLVMVHKDSSRTLARMKAESPRLARHRAKAAQRQAQE